jgi:hypothetical protein
MNHFAMSPRAVLPPEAGMAALVAAFVLIVYARTLYPGVAGGDSGELAGAIATGGVIHPPGYRFLERSSHVSSGERERVGRRQRDSKLHLHVPFQHRQQCDERLLAPTHRRERNEQRPGQRVPRLRAQFLEHRRLEVLGMTADCASWGSLRS